MTTDFFVKARNVLRGSPRAVPVPAAPTVYMPPVVVPTPVAIGPKPSDVETIGIAYHFQMQTIAIGAKHALEQVPVQVASLVGGR